MYVVPELTIDLHVFPNCKQNCFVCECLMFNLPFNEIINFSFPDMEEDKFVIYP